MSFSVTDKPLDPTGYEQKTSFNTTAVVLDRSKIGKDAQFVYLQAEGDDVRWLDSGETPTASVGQIIPAGQDLWYTGNIDRLRVIGVSAGSILNASGYKA